MPEVLEDEDRLLGQVKDLLGHLLGIGRAALAAAEAALQKILKGLSCRDYEACMDPVAETFGLAPSRLSRRFKWASARKLAELQERDVSGYNVVGLWKERGSDAGRLRGMVLPPKV
jgi:hypothetical protein